MLRLAAYVLIRLVVAYGCFDVAVDVGDPPSTYWSG